MYASFLDSWVLRAIRSKRDDFLIEISSETNDKFAKPVKLSVQSTDEIVIALDACNQHVARGREISSQIRHSRHPHKSREHTLIDKSILRVFY